MEPSGTEPAFRGRVLSVDVEEWPGHPPYEVIHHPGAAAVLPITPSGDVVLVRQLRPPVRQFLTEIPAGLLDVADEDALTCAARELYEETGYRHTTIEFLAGYYASAGSTDEYVHLFWCETGAAPEGEPEEGIEVVLKPLGELIAAAKNGKVRDVKTAMALLLAEGRARPSASG
ncbi:MAG: 8-oxo-dGDP phosphatase [Actinomycetota bacterium]|jgi:ADP-ribose pyrophosphatase|nr:8-oxo-dGDP phosphatase [Actinomycetota bacterium]